MEEGKIKIFSGTANHKLAEAIAKEMNCSEAELSKFTRIKHEGDYLLFSFQKGSDTYCYNEQENSITRL